MKSSHIIDIIIFFIISQIKTLSKKATPPDKPEGGVSRDKFILKLGYAD